jgi:hypothetical protein
MGVHELRVLGWWSLPTMGLLRFTGAREGAKFRGKFGAAVDRRHQHHEQGGAPRRHGRWEIGGYG